MCVCMCLPAAKKSSSKVLGVVKGKGEGKGSEMDPDLILTPLHSTPDPEVSWMG